jgi:hypothetical protein
MGENRSGSQLNTTWNRRRPRGGRVQMELPECTIAGEAVRATHRKMVGLQRNTATRPRYQSHRFGYVRLELMPSYLPAKIIGKSAIAAIGVSSFDASRWTDGVDGRDDWRYRQERLPMIIGSGNDHKLIDDE